MFAIAGYADAQPGNAAAAEQLFAEARELARVGRWAEACPKFEASLRADPALGTELNLATCYEHLGKLARAWAMYHESIALAAQAGDARRRDYAQSHAAALEPRLARLTITAPVGPPAGFVARWDGVPIADHALGAVLYADPGRHELVASAPGFRPFVKAVALAEGQAETLAIPSLAAAPGAQPDAPAAPSDGAPATPELAVVSSPRAAPGSTAPSISPSVASSVVSSVASTSTRTYVAAGLGAAGLVATGVGLLFGDRARSAFNDAKSKCGAALACTPSDYPVGRQFIHTARSDAAISTVLVATGGAAIAAGVLVYLTRPADREHRAAQVVPVAHDRGAGLAISGSF
jgi:tetratricopeptide (TPR) repeat protein